MSVSVVIPVQNGGALLQRVLSNVQEQVNPAPERIVCIDSASTDGSRDYLAKASHADPRILVLDIDPARFNHGGTRNLGVEHTDTEWVAFLTQDACPMDAHWLEALCRAAASPDITGVTGRQVPYPDAPLCVRRELTFHFERLAQQPHCMRLADLEHTDLARRQAAHFFSNNNTLIRRDVWERIPFPEAEYGEDQLWAERILRAGYAKAYAPDAVVQHSHNYNWSEMYTRATIEGSYNQQQFGYQLIPSVGQLPRLWYREVQSDAYFRRRFPADAGTRMDALRSAWLLSARLWGWYRGGRVSA